MNRGRRLVRDDCGLPAFAAEVKTSVEPWQLAEYIGTAHQSEPFDPDSFVDEDTDLGGDERREDINRSARDLLLVEQAKEWLLGVEG